MSKGFDKYGSLKRTADNCIGDYLDLTEIGVDFRVTELPANIHFYWADETKQAICSSAFVVMSRRYRNIDQVRQFLSSPGIHYVLYCVVGSNETQGGMLWLRSAVVTPDKGDVYSLALPAPNIMLSSLQK